MITLFKNPIIFSGVPESTQRFKKIRFARNVLRRGIRMTLPESSYDINTGCCTRQKKVVKTRIIQIN